MLREANGRRWAFSVRPSCETPPTGASGDPTTGPIRAMTVDPNNTKPRDGDDRAWNVPSEARETFERVSSLQLEELLRTANGDEARGRAGRDGNGFAMPEDSDADENSSDESEVSDAGDEREDLEAPPLYLGGPARPTVRPPAVTDQISQNFHINSQKILLPGKILS